MHPSGSVALHTTWHVRRRHVDLCRTATALCPGRRDRTASRRTASRRPGGGHSEPEDGR